MFLKRYCLRYKTNKHAELLFKVQKKKKTTTTKNIDANMMKTKNGRFLLSSKCPICGSKKSKFMKEQEEKEDYWVV